MSIEDERAASERFDSSSKDIERFPSHSFSLLIIQWLLSSLTEVMKTLRGTHRDAHKVPYNSDMEDSAPINANIGTLQILKSDREANAAILEKLENPRDDLNTSPIQMFLAEDLAHRAQPFGNYIADFGLTCPTLRDGRLQISMIASADGEAVLGKEGRQRRWWKGSRSKNCELNCSRPLMPIRCWFDAFIHWNSAAEGPSKEAPDSICWGSRPYKGNVFKKDQKVNPPYQCSFEAIDV